MSSKTKRCEHLLSIAALEVKKPVELVCEECVKTGSSWVHLRTCQECGLTLCCDSSPNKHATAHFNTYRHPVVASAEPGEKWLWCYVDKQITKY